MRVFTAIPVPKASRDKLIEVTRGRLPVPYISTTNLHITLNFLGDLTDDEVKLASEIFPQAVGESRSRISIEFDKFVNFRNQIHLTLKENPGLRQLQADLEDAFRGQNFHLQDRNYYPHAKLANMHIDNKLYRERKLENFPVAELAAVNFVADTAALYESKLLLHHAHHRPLLEIKLV